MSQVQLALVRHGPSAIADGTAWIDRAGVESVRARRGGDHGRRRTAAGAHRARGADLAIEWLEELVGGSEGKSLVVTHGVFRRTLAQRLVARGWISARRVGGYRPWSVWSFSRP